MENTQAEHAARREGQLRAEAEWHYIMSQRATSGDNGAQEVLDRMAAEPPAAGELQMMREHPDAFDVDFLKRWKHLL